MGVSPHDFTSSSEQNLPTSFFLSSKGVSPRPFPPLLRPRLQRERTYRPEDLRIVVFRFAFPVSHPSRARFCVPLSFTFLLSCSAFFSSSLIISSSLASPFLRLVVHPCHSSFLSLLPRHPRPNYSARHPDLPFSSRPKFPPHLFRLSYKQKVKPLRVYFWRSALSADSKLPAPFPNPFPHLYDAFFHELS